MIEIQIINKVLSKKSIDWLKGKPYYNNPDLFGGYNLHYKMILDHYNQYNEVPDKVTFLDKFPEFDVVEVTDSDESLLSRMDEAVLFTKFLGENSLQHINELLQSDSFAAVEALDLLYDKVHHCIKNLTETKLQNSSIFSVDPFHQEIKEGIKTGFEEIDLETKGISSDGELVGLMASTNQGKTWILLKMAVSAYLQGKNVVFIEPEMSKLEIVQRFAVLLLGIDINHIISGEVLKSKIEQYQKIKEEHQNSFTLFDLNDVMLTPEKIEAIVNSDNCEILYIDGLSHCTDNRYEMNIQVQMKEISRQLSVMAAKHKVPIVVSVQANRDAKNESRVLPPRMEKIASCYAACHYMSKLFTMIQHDGHLKILMEKSRSSGVGNVWVYDWNISRGMFKYLRTDNINDVETPTNNNQRQERVDRMTENSMQNLRRNHRPEIPF